MSALLKLPVLGLLASWIAQIPKATSLIPEGVVDGLEQELLDLAKRRFPRFAPVLTLANVQRAIALAAEVEHAAADAEAFVAGLLAQVPAAPETMPAEEPPAPEPAAS